MALGFAIFWQIAVWTFGLHQIHAQARYDRAHFDLKHCAPIVNRDGYPLWMCLPKDGCWLLDAAGSPACWRVAALTGSAAQE